MNTTQGKKTIQSIFSILRLSEFSTIYCTKESICTNKSDVMKECENSNSENPSLCFID